jgi:hypothetical protein
MYAPVQPLVLTSAEWKNADFALLNGEIAWELESAISSTGTGQNIIYSDVLTGNVYMLRGDGAQVKGGSGYARLRVSLASFTVKDSGGNTVDIEDHINKIDGSAHGISGLISAATNGVLKGTDIIDSLVSDSAVKVLSAKQGKALQTNLGNHAGITNGSAHGINTLIGAHNTAAEAHADIRSAAGSAQSKADTADGKIDTHAGIENGSAHGINTLIGAHNTAAEAHADIRARIDDGLDDLNSALADHRSDTEAHLIPDQLAEGIAAHNEDEAAHPDILEDI